MGVDKWQNHSIIELVYRSNIYRVPKVTKNYVKFSCKINEWCNNFQEKGKTRKGKDLCKTGTESLVCKYNVPKILRSSTSGKEIVFILQNKTKNTKTKFVSAIDDESVLRVRKVLFPQQCESNNRGGEC